MNVVHLFQFFSFTFECFSLHCSDARHNKDCQAVHPVCVQAIVLERADGERTTALARGESRARPCPSALIR